MSIIPIIQANCIKNQKYLNKILVLYRKSFRPNFSDASKFTSFTYYLENHDGSFIIVLDKTMLNFVELVTTGVRDFDILEECFGMIFLTRKFTFKIE